MGGGAKEDLGEGDILIHGAIGIPVEVAWWHLMALPVTSGRNRGGVEPTCYPNVAS